MSLNAPMTLALGGRRRSDPGVLFLGQATHWFDRKDIDGTQVWGSRTSAAELTLGANSSAGTDDPFTAPAATFQRLALPGITGNYASIPDNANLDTADEWSVAVRVYQSDWDSGSVVLAEFVARWDGPSGSGRQFVLRRSPTSARTLDLVCQIGGAAVTHPFGYTTALTGGNWYWIKATFDPDNGSGQRLISMEYAPDSPTVPTSWTAAAAARTNAGTGALDASSYPLVMGTGAAASRAMAGQVARVVYGPATGDAVADVDFGLATADMHTFTASTGQTVTVARSASGAKSSIVPAAAGVMVADGSNDLFSGVTFDTPYIVRRTWSTNTPTAAIVQADPTSTLAAGEVLAVVDYERTLDSGEQALVLATVTAGAYT